MSGRRRTHVWPSNLIDFRIKCRALRGHNTNLKMPPAKRARYSEDTDFNPEYSNIGNEDGEPREFDYDPTAPAYMPGHVLAPGDEFKTDVRNTHIYEREYRVQWRELDDESQNTDPECVPPYGPDRKVIGRVIARILE